MLHLDAELLEHIKLGHNDEALSLLQNNKYFCHLNEGKKSTLLRHAAEYGNTNFAQKLIDLGANVNAQNSYGETALLLAVQNYHRQMVKLLLQSGADMFINDKGGEYFLKKINRDIGVRMSIMRQEIFKIITPESLTKIKFVKSKAFHEDCPIYNFIPSKNLKLTKFLLKKGSPVDAKDQKIRETALHLAVKNLDVAHVKLLLKYGADVNARNFQQKRPLAFIKDLKNDKKMKIAQILIEAGTTLMDQTYSERIIETVLSQGNVQIIKAVMQTDIDLYANVTWKNVPIDYLFRNRNPEVYEELRNFNIDLSKCSNGQSTVLHRAVSIANGSLVQYLLERDVDVNVKDSFGRTPLCMVFDILEMDYPISNPVENCWKVIEILLKYDAEPQILTKENYSHIKAFSMPVINKYVEIMRPIFAELAMYEVSGREIDSFMRNEIKKRKEFQTVYDEYKKELEEMKRIKIDESVSLCDFLMAKCISNFAGNTKLIMNLRCQMKKCNSDSFYHRKLQLRFIKVDKMVAINEVFVKFYNVSVTNVAEKIVGYLY